MFKIDDGHALFNVQLAWIAVCVDTKEVVEAVGEVGILLHFAENHSGANGMRGSRGNVKSIARRDREALEKRFQPAIFYSRLKLASIDFRDETEQECRAWFSGDDVP